MKVTELVVGQQVGLVFVYPWGNDMWGIQTVTKTNKVRVEMQGNTAVCGIHYTRKFSTKTGRRLTDYGPKHALFLTEDEYNAMVSTNKGLAYER